MSLSAWLKLSSHIDQCIGDGSNESFLKPWWMHMISFGMMMRADDLNRRYHNHCTSVQYWNQGGARSPWPKLMPIHFLCLSGFWQLWIQFIQVTHDDCKGFKLEKQDVKIG